MSLPHPHRKSNNSRNSLSSSNSADEIRSRINSSSSRSSTSSNNSNNSKNTIKDHRFDILREYYSEKLKPKELNTNTTSESNDGKHKSSIFSKIGTKDFITSHLPKKMRHSSIEAFENISTSIQKKLKSYKNSNLEKEITKKTQNQIKKLNTPNNLFNDEYAHFITEYVKNHKKLKSQYSFNNVLRLQEENPEEYLLLPQALKNEITDLSNYAGIKSTKHSSIIEATNITNRNSTTIHDLKIKEINDPEFTKKMQIQMMNKYARDIKIMNAFMNKKGYKRVPLSLEEIAKTNYNIKLPEYYNGVLNAYLRFAKGKVKAQRYLKYENDNVNDIKEAIGEVLATGINKPNISDFTQSKFGRLTRSLAQVLPHSHKKTLRYYPSSSSFNEEEEEEENVLNKKVKPKSKKSSKTKKILGNPNENIIV